MVIRVSLHSVGLSTVTSSNTRVESKTCHEHKEQEFELLGGFAIVVSMYILF